RDDHPGTARAGGIHQSHPLPARLRRRNRMTVLARTAEVTRRYGDVVALDRVSVEIRAGELVGLLGPNGAGKSTLINLFVGLRRPTSGTVELLGGSPADPAVRRGIGVTPQE